MKEQKILFMLTGSIACFKACQLISKLVQERYQVQIVASASALRFVGEATLEGLTRRPVYSDLWQSGRMMDHISLNRWADLIVVAPATGNFINKAAAGIANSLVETIFLAHDFKKPLIIAPAMNTAMWSHPTTIATRNKLKSMGIRLLGTDSGNLACGESGEGRLLDVDQIFSEIQACLAETKSSIKINSAEGKERPSNRARVLITSGGTSESLDDVRIITNRSTGATGAVIAQAFSEYGYDVTYIHAKTAEMPKSPCRSVEFESFDDLADVLCRELSASYEVVIHAAAVSDFSVEKVAGKISSDKIPEFKFKKNPKLVNQVREWSTNKHITLVAFKMTSTESIQERESAVSNLIKNAQADLVVHNDISEMKPRHLFHIFHRYSGKTEAISSIGKVIDGKEDLARTLLEYTQSKLETKGAI